MKHKNISVSCGILLKSALIVLLLGVSFTSWSQVQIINTFAGNGTTGYNGDNIPATAAELYSPSGVAVDNSGNIYIADEANNRVREVNTSGVISTIAGNGYTVSSGFGGYSGDGGPATAAELNYPNHVAVDASGNVYITDYENARIREVNTSGIINTIAGNGITGYSGDGGPATAAEFDTPYGIAVDAFGNIYIADYNNSRIREVNTSGVISTFAGNGGGGFSGDGGPATAAELHFPSDVAVDASNNVYIADETNSRIREVNTSGIISTIAGNGKANFSGDGGPATAAELDEPDGVTVDVSGNVYIADFANWRIREVNTSGVISTIAGSGTKGYSGDGGPATSAELSNPTGVVVDASGNVYIADPNNKRVREVTTDLNVYLYASAIANVSCTGGNNGSASVSVYNDVNTPYTYSWSPGGGTISTASGLSAGTYTITVTDNTEATVSASVTITQPGALTVTLSSITPSCSGENNGKATVTTSSTGTSPYTYSWSPSGGTKSTASLLSAGTYTVTIKDHCSTSATISVTITQSLPLTASALVTANVSCNGQSDGSATATVTAGTGQSPYTYLWNGIEGNSTATGLSAGPYTIFIEDNCESEAIIHITITQPDALTANAFAPAICYGNTPTATVSPSGGTSPYTYSWSGGGGTNSEATGLSAGIYTITVMDNNGCNATSATTVTQPIALTTGTALISNACNGTSNGNAFATPSGGTSPYTYSWSNGITNNPTGATLGAGTYRVTVHDNCGASATASVTIKESTAIIPTAFTADNVSCNGGSNGEAKVSVTGGSTPYTYSWSPIGGSTYIAAGLSMGAYTVTITDNDGCSATSATSLTQPALLRDSAILTYPVCAGGTGTATIGVTGGTAPYAFAWTPNVSTTATATGLTVRSYVVQVKDHNGCNNDLTFSITQPLALRDSVVPGSIIGSCNGVGTGSASVGVKYGNPPYTYSWSRNGGNNSSATGLSAGVYTVTVSDGGSCSTTTTVTIGQPGALSVTAYLSGNISCNGGSNGQAKVTVNGGSSPYIYSWSPVGGSTYIANGLSAGTYTVSVSDNCGSSATSSVIVTQPALLRDSAALTYPVCNGGTGTATIGVKGGTGPYSFAWSPNVSTTASATGLAVRGYVVQVKDHDGCSNNLTFSISQPPALRDSIVKPATVNLSCNGSSIGSATVGVKYGTPPYTYSWSGNGGNSSTAGGLTAGVYTVTVNDGGGCTVTASVTITQPNALLPNAYVGVNISCNGGSTGQAKVSVSGGSTPYTYSWSPGGATSSTVGGLSAGTYTVIVMDKCVASATSSVVISQPAVLSDSIANIYAPACTAGATGEATIGVTGGTTPYKYAWSPNVSSTDSASGLTVRSYIIQVKDNNGCSNDITLNVTCSNAPTATYKPENTTCCPVTDNINLYPNPNTGQFTISGLKQGMILELYDYTGKMISTMTTTNETMQLNINQADGIYLIRILDKDGNLVDEKKMVKMQ